LGGRAFPPPHPFHPSAGGLSVPRSPGDAGLSFPPRQSLDSMHEKGMTDDPRYGQMKGMGMRPGGHGMGPPPSPMDQHSQGWFCARTPPPAPGDEPDAPQRPPLDTPGFWGGGGGGGGWSPGGVSRVNPSAGEGSFGLPPPPSPSLSPTSRLPLPARRLRTRLQPGAGQRPINGLTWFVFFFSFCPFFFGSSGMGGPNMPPPGPSGVPPGMPGQPPGGPPKPWPEGERDPGARGRGPIPAQVGPWGSGEPSPGADVPAGCSGVGPGDLGMSLRPQTSLWVYSASQSPGMVWVGRDLSRSPGPEPSPTASWRGATTNLPRNRVLLLRRLQARIAHRIQELENLPGSLAGDLRTKATIELKALRLLNFQRQV
ncbi:SMCA4 protein, partial [Bucorvus abyssinicus]|nr:SMCA4 protein [Bucorvus abyssinicus]